MVAAATTACSSSGQISTPRILVSLLPGKSKTRIRTAAQADHQQQHERGFLRAVGVSLAAVCLGNCLLFTAPAFAVTTEDHSRSSIWQCLLNGCRQELSHCLMDPACAANAVCLETCDPKDMECQVRCGDIFQSKVVSELNTCVVTKSKCIPKKLDNGEFPVPPDCALVKKFDVRNFTGEWFITSGLNPTFDVFDCQIQQFTATVNELTGKFTWRISLPGGAFLTRDDVQHFVQDEQNPGHLSNHGNQYLHYADDWFVVSSKFENKPDDFVFVYYRGSNDAWDGYGGAVVYTRSRKLPDSIIPQLKQAADKVGLDFDKFVKTNNSCSPQPTLLARVLSLPFAEWRLN